MSIIGDYRDELEERMFIKFLELISENLETESILLIPNPRTYFKIDATDMIDKCSDIFGYSQEFGGKKFNEIMDNKYGN